MPNDINFLLVLGVGAAIIVWLIFSILKKLFGLALIAGVAFAAYLVWANPELLSETLKQFGVVYPR